MDFQNNKEKDKEFVYNITKTLEYHWSGQFMAPNEKYVHLKRSLMDFELIVMIKGELYIKDEWEEYVLKEGEYLLMEPTKIQSGYRPSECSFYWLHFGTNNYGYYVKNEEPDIYNSRQNIINIKKQGKLLYKDKVYELMRQLIDSDVKYMNKVSNEYLTTAILCEISNQTTMAENKVLKDDFIRNIEQYIDENISKELKIKDIAKDFGYNEKYLSTMFKNKLGISLKHFIDNKKIERAKYLLINTNVWITEISESLGYANVQSFYNVFKKETSVTPMEYRDTYSDFRSYSE